MYSKVSQRSRHCFLVEGDSAGDFSDTPRDKKDPGGRRWGASAPQGGRPFDLEVYLYADV